MKLFRSWGFDERGSGSWGGGGDLSDFRDVNMVNGQGSNIAKLGLIGRIAMSE